MTFLVTWDNDFRVPSLKYAVITMPWPWRNNVFRQSGTGKKKRVSSAKVPNFPPAGLSLCPEISLILWGWWNLLEFSLSLYWVLTTERTLLVVWFCALYLKMIYKKTVHTSRIHSVVGHFALTWLLSFFLLYRRFFFPCCTNLVALDGDQMTTILQTLTYSRYAQKLDI